MAAGSGATPRKARIPRRVVVLALVGIAPVASACTADDGAEDSVVELGCIEFDTFPVMFEAPATVTAGQPFLVRVTSYRGGCVAYERTDVELASDSADLVVLQRRYLRDACTSHLRLDSNDVTLSFAAPGSKTIRLRGRRVNSQVDEEIQVLRSVVVE